MLDLLQDPLWNHILAKIGNLFLNPALVKSKTMGIRRHHARLLSLQLQQGTHKKRTRLVRRAGENRPPDQFLQHDAVDREFLSLFHLVDLREISGLHAQERKSGLSGRNLYDFRRTIILDYNFLIRKRPYYLIEIPAGYHYFSGILHFRFYMENDADFVIRSLYFQHVIISIHINTGQDRRLRLAGYGTSRNLYSLYEFRFQTGEFQDYSPLVLL